MVFIVVRREAHEHIGIASGGRIPNPVSPIVLTQDGG